MDVTQIPFILKVGISRASSGNLELPLSASNSNHLNTVHASAQFALAETASGDMLQALFPELVGKVVPVLRESQIKFRKPATSLISAYASVAEEAVVGFREQFERKGRATIAVVVELKDVNGVVTCSAEFGWFVQALT